MINCYLWQTFSDESGDPVVRNSRVVLDGTVYCAVLRTPLIASRFVSEPFTLSSPTPASMSHPHSTYTSSTPKGVPAITFNYNAL